MFNSLVPNGDIYLSSISVLLEDNGHAIPLRMGGEKKGLIRIENITQIDERMRHMMMMNRLIPEVLLHFFRKKRKR
jgi:hypothetical protein